MATARLKNGNQIEFVNQGSTIELVDYEPRTVAKIDLDKGERVQLGRGDSENPLKAEGFLHGVFNDNGGTAFDNGELICEVTTTGGNTPKGVKDGELFRADLTEIDDASDRKELARKMITASQRFVGYPYEVRFKIELDDGAGPVTFNPDDGSNALQVDGRYQVQ